jgi:long-chain fatty acid transport protein
MSCGGTINAKLPMNIKTIKKQCMQTNLQIGRKNRLILKRAFVLFALLSALPLKAEGFRDATIGAFDLGRSGGRIAQVDDSTAVQNNPANLVDVTNAEVQFAPSVIYISVDYKAPNGESAATIHPLKVLPNFFASMPLDEGRYVLGFGVTVPYGLANQWKTSSSAYQPGGTLFNNAANFGKLTTINFNPSIATKIGDHLQLGIGLDVMWSELEIRQFIAAPQVEAHASGDGMGYGGNLGLTWKITDHQRLALTYRSTMTVNYNGRMRIENTGGPGGDPSTSFGSQIKYPNIIALGYGIDVTDKIRLESDVEWLSFSQFQNLGIRTGNIAALGGLNLSQNIPQKWHNTFTAGIGGDWKFTDNWVMRAGYQFFESPVPDSTFSPTIPDANQNVITVGIGWRGKHSSLELAYGLDFYNDRNITNDQNPALNGRYTFNVHLFSIAYRYSF